MPSGIPERTIDASSELIEDIGKYVFLLSKDLLILKFRTYGVRSTSILGETSISCILSISESSEAESYDEKSDRTVLETCVTRIFVKVTDLATDPSELNFGIADQRDLVQAEPVQYKTRTPASSLIPPFSLDTLAARLIELEPSTEIKEPLTYILIVGTAINVLNFRTNLFVGTPALS